MKTVQLGIVGLGNMGTAHARNILAGKISRCELMAVCDPNPAALAEYAKLRTFSRSDELIRSNVVDALVIATPHFDHTSIGIDALEHGLHVLVEKPLAVHKADCERLIAAHENPATRFALMLNQRTDPAYRKLRELIATAALGEIRRINWIITNWYRTDAYYASSSWRATWAGEGGGVLLNQCTHNLDLFQWLFGMPSRVRGFCQFGRYHPIEVEDDVTAYFEYANGATAVLITSTGESPGSNRLEVTGEHGKVVLENDVLTFTKNAVPMTEFSRSATEPFATPPTSEERFSFANHGGQHHEILQNFVDAILDCTPLVAPASEGVHSVELANAILLSSARDETISLPLNAAVYETWLQQKVKTSQSDKDTDEC
jgi:predicted dehydrogenase